MFPRSDTCEAPMHILLTCVAAAGHINPLIQLAHFLAEERCNKPSTFVTLGILTNDNTKGKIHLPIHDRIRVLSDQEFDLAKWIANLEETNRQLAGEMTSRVTQTYLHWPPIDAVIFDFISSFGQIIAEELCVPSFVYVASPMFCFWSMVRHDYLASLRAQTNPPSTYDIPGIGSFQLSPSDGEEGEKVWGNLCAICTEAYKKADGCLANDVQSFYSEVFLNSLPPEPLPRGWKILLCGPMALKDPRTRLELVESESDETLSFASKFPARSVLFIALGSCWSLKSQDLIELVRGVAATNRPFIFAYRGKSPAEDPFKAFAAKDQPAKEPTEEDGLPIGFREEVAHRGLIISWVNQPRLLAHPSIGAFMTHCGWNSIMEGMAFGGVPFILLPIGGDQVANAEFLSCYLKCGKLMRGLSKSETLDRLRVQNTVNEAFNDEDMRKRAFELHRLARQDAVENGVVENNILQFYHRIMELKSS